MCCWRTLILLTALVLLSTCGGGKLEVRDLWGRPAPPAAANAAFYVTMTNNGAQDEQLLAVHSDACRAAELHQTIMAENGVMRMQPLPGGVIDIPAGATVTLAPGGLHLMCIDKVDEFRAGDKIPVTLTFANAGVLTLTAEIRDDR